MTEVRDFAARRDGTARWTQGARVLATRPSEFHPSDPDVAEIPTDFKKRFGISLVEAVTAALAWKFKAGSVTRDADF